MALMFSVDDRAPSGTTGMSVRLPAKSGNSVASMTALLAFLEAENLPGLADPLGMARFDRFFLASRGKLDGAAAATMPDASYEQLYGYQGDEPETGIPETLNPNADAVQYDVGDDREYG